MTFIQVLNVVENQMHNAKASNDTLTAFAVFVHTHLPQLTLKLYVSRIKCRFRSSGTDIELKENSSVPSLRQCC